jgi:DNA-binding HxlR family transcriptional regulator
VKPMGSSYHQFCPVAKAMELLDQRWTMLIIRELLLGSRHFNDIRRGVPKMSPSLLSKRLHDLTRAGIVQRRNDGHDVEYTLTAAGTELQAVVESLGAWGMRWIGRIGDEDLDPKLLMWDLHRHVDAALIPPGRTVVSFRFMDVPGWSAAFRSGSIHLEGPERLRRAVPKWFPPTPFAQVPRSPVDITALGRANQATAFRVQWTLHYDGLINSATVITLPSVSASSATRMRSSGLSRGGVMILPPTSVARSRATSRFCTSKPRPVRVSVPLPPGCSAMFVPATTNSLQYGELITTFTANASV